MTLNNSVLGRHDGDVYGRLASHVSKEPLNRDAVHNVAYGRYLSRLIQADYDSPDVDLLSMDSMAPKTPILNEEANSNVKKIHVTDHPLLRHERDLMRRFEEGNSLRQRMRSRL